MNNRLNTEKKVFKKMVLIYCKNKHQKNTPCSECREIIEYGIEKIDNCFYAEKKPFCSKCSIHCYNKNMQKKVKDIMRFSGPRIIFYHPFISLKHLFSSLL